MPVLWGLWQFALSIQHYSPFIYLIYLLFTSSSYITYFVFSSSHANESRNSLPKAPCQIRFKFDLRYYWRRFVLWVLTVHTYAHMKPLHQVISRIDKTKLGNVVLFKIMYRACTVHYLSFKLCSNIGLIPLDMPSGLNICPSPTLTLAHHTGILLPFTIKFLIIIVGSLSRIMSKFSTRLFADILFRAWWTSISTCHHCNMQVLYLQLWGRIISEITQRAKTMPRVV